MSKFKNVAVFFKSLKFRVLILLILFGIIPSLALRFGILNSYENRAVYIRTSEILSQAKILANQIVSSDYLVQSDNKQIDSQLEQLSTIYDGRIMVIDKSFRILKDTYNLDENKTIMSEDVIKSAAGQEITK